MANTPWLNQICYMFVVRYLFRLLHFGFDVYIAIRIFFIYIYIFSSFGGKGHDNFLGKIFINISGTNVSMFSKNIQEVQESLGYVNNPSALKVISLE